MEDQEVMGKIIGGKREQRVVAFKIAAEFELCSWKNGVVRPFDLVRKIRGECILALRRWPGSD
jgi:hypothetical protein